LLYFSKFYSTFATISWQIKCALATVLVRYLIVFVSEPIERQKTAPSHLAWGRHAESASLISADWQQAVDAAAGSRSARPIRSATAAAHCTDGCRQPRGCVTVWEQRCISTNKFEEKGRRTMRFNDEVYLVSRLPTLCILTVRAPTLQGVPFI